jgi:hypothetical protein
LGIHHRDFLDGEISVPDVPFPIIRAYIIEMMEREREKGREGKLMQRIYPSKDRWEIKVLFEFRWLFERNL